MPSRHSSGHSLADAAALADNLGISTLEIDIDPRIVCCPGCWRRRSSPAVAPVGAGAPLSWRAGGVTDQNLQARIRGVLLMALANEHGWLVLTTATRASRPLGIPRSTATLRALTQ